MAPLVGPHPSQARHLNVDFLYCLGLRFAGSDSCFTMYFALPVVGVVGFFS